VLGDHVRQQGSLVEPERLRFDFTHDGPLTEGQLDSVLSIINGDVLGDGGVETVDATKAEAEQMGAVAFFGDKYGDTVRVVQIGGTPHALDGYSMELCGGTHVRATGEIGLFRIVSEAAVAAGVRRIEAVAGHKARTAARSDSERLQGVASRLGAPLAEVEKKLEATLARQKELEKELTTLRQKAAAGLAKDLLEKVAAGTVPSIVEEISGADGNELQTIVDALKTSFDGVIFLAGVADGAVSLVAATGKAHQATLPAGKLISAVAPLVGGKGGGKPDGARGGGRDASGLQSALAKAKELIAAGKL
jgi:alanyl-tRNA synthetase